MMTTLNFFLAKNCVNERLKSVSKLTDSDQENERKISIFCSRSVQFVHGEVEKERKSKSVFKGGSRTEKSLLAINPEVTTPPMWNCST